MFDDRIGDMQKMLARMGPAGRQKYAADHADDPIAVSMALFVNNIAKELTEGREADPAVQAPVVQQAIQAMNQPQMPQGMPQRMPPQAQPQGPQQAMPQKMPPQGQTRMAADGGYMDSRLPEDMGIGALPERSLSGMADGGIVGFSAGGNPKGKKLLSFDDALDAEGVRDPRQRAFLKALYGQESGSGADTTTSNQGAVGHMQIKPSTFKQVADKNMDINNPFDNMRAGIRYGMQGYQAANGDPVLAGAHYYGGPGGMEALAKGQVRTDSKNPKAPNTLEYGKSIAQRMTALLPIGSAQAQETAPAAASAANPMASDQAQSAAPAAPEDTGSFTNYSPNELAALRGGAKTAGQVVRSLVQNPLAKIIGGYAGIAGSVLPGAEGQGADYAKRVEDYLGYNPEYTADSKKVLGVLNAPSAALSKYVARPAGEFLAENVNPATGAIVQGAIEAAPAALGFLGRFGRGPKAAAPEAAVAAEAPVAAAPVAPPVRTVPTTAQRAAADTAQPVPQGVARVNQAAQDAAAATGPQLPPFVGPPKPVATGIATLAPEAAALAPEAAALRTAAEARAKARAAERAAPAAAPAAAAAAAEEGAAAAAPRTGLAALPEAAGAAAAAEVPAVSRMAAARAAIGEAGRGRAALLPAIAAAGAGTGSGGTSGDEREPYSTGEYQGKSGIADIDIGPKQPPLTPEVKKEAVAAAKAEIPTEDRKGLGYEDLLMFGLQLMAGKSQYALQNVGEAGVAALTAKQAREKVEYDRRKTDAEIAQSGALVKYYEKHGNYLDAEAARKAAEDKPQMAYQKALEAEVAKLANNAMYMAAKPAEQAQMENAARARAKQNFLSVYPELAGTMGGAGSSLDLTKWGIPAKI